MGGGVQTDIFGRRVFHGPGGVNLVFGQPSMVGIGLELLSKAAEAWVARKRSESRENAESEEEARQVEIPMLCTLEELWEGCVKDVRGPAQCGDDVFSMEVPPGAKEGTRVSFLTRTLTGQPISIVYVVKEAPHALFRREGDDLVYQYVCTHKEAAAGLTITVPLASGQSKMIRLKPDWITEGKRHKITGEGMPKRGGPERGNLIVEFKVKSQVQKVLDHVRTWCTCKVKVRTHVCFRVFGARMRMCMRVCVFVGLNAYIYTYMYVYIYIYTYIYMNY